MEAIKQTFLLQSWEAGSRSGAAICSPKGSAMTKEGDTIPITSPRDWLGLTQTAVPHLPTRMVWHRRGPLEVGMFVSRVGGKMYGSGGVGVGARDERSCVPNEFKEGVSG
jgi:hypothetical protein